MDWIYEPWPWWVSGIVIASIMALLLFFGQSFGFSSNLRTLCAASGAGKRIKFFDFDWKAQSWNLVFLVGAIVGGFVTDQFLTADNYAVQVSAATVSDLAALGFAAPASVQPTELYGLDAILSLKGLLILTIGGLLVGFGSRYAGGCTSGHAISGLSMLQLPSLIAVIGFFAGGLLMTHFIFPLIF